MDISHITSQSLLRLLSLTEQKDELIKIIVEVETEIARTLRGGATSVLTVVEVAEPAKARTLAPAKASAKAPKAKSGRSGGLKNQILALLEAAGSQGLRVKEIAEKLGARATNISVWFSTTGKKLTTKVEPGRYALKGAKTVAAEPTKVEAPAKPVKGKKSKMSAAGRARISAAAKARWAARRAGKATPVAAAAKPAKATKKTKKNNISPEGRAKLAAAMKARWAARKAGKATKTIKA